MINPFATPKYLENFGLGEPPYTTNPFERYLFLTDAHQKAISLYGRLIHNPANAIQAGAIQVSNFESLATFGRLFPM